MEAKKFALGQIVYSENGEQAEYVAATHDGHIVRPIVEAGGDYDYEDAPYDHICDPTMWRSVFAEPPVAKFSAELQALHEQIAEAKKAMHEQDAEDARRRRERQEKFKRFSMLDDLEAFIDGKITHYVQYEYYGPPKIIAVEDTKSESNSYRSELRMLSLNASLRDGKISWVLNQYKDGGGNPHTVTPCTSYEQAAEEVKAVIVRHFTSHGERTEPRQDWITAAERHNVPVPETYRRKVAESRISEIERNAEYNRRQARDYAASVAKSDAELAELRAYLAAAEA